MAVTSQREAAGERVGVVTTIRNEADSIEAFLEALLSQSRTPDEIVIVDGGSTDQTAERVEGVLSRSPVPIRFIRSPGSNIAAGRNIAIRSCGASVIAVADAGTILRRDWLAEITKPLLADRSIGVSGGFFLPGGATVYERILAGVVTPQLPEIRAESFLPSSRSVAFRRHWWEVVGGYPEWLDHCEDLVFVFSQQAAGAKFVFSPTALVEWNAAPNLRQLARKWFYYGRGDAHARLWLVRSYTLRPIAYLLGGFSLVLSRRSPVARGALFVGCNVWFKRPYQRLKRIPPGPTLIDRLSGWLMVPVVVVLTDIAKFMGFASGQIEKRRRS